MSEIRESLDNLQGGKKWIKRMTRDGHGNMCILGSLRSARMKKIIDLIAAEVRGHYPDRVLILSQATASVANFNDHPDTTFDDVRVVMEKADLRLEEMV